MKAPAFAAQAQEKWASFWQARNQRERRILVLALGVAIFALVYGLLLDPALSGRARLQQELPQLRQQVAQMQAMVREAAALPQAGTAIEPLSRQGLEAGLASKGLKPQNLAISGEIVRLQLEGVTFAALLDWLDEAQKTSLLAVSEANILVQAQPGIVNATLTLRQQAAP